MRTPTKPSSISLALCLLACLTQPSLAGEVVARARLTTLPDSPTFPLQFTVPVPPGEVIPGRSASFKVRLPDGTLLPTDIFPVSSYPNPSQGADVVQAVARATRPAGLAPGAPLSVELIREPSGRAVFALSQAMTALLRGPDAAGFSVRARDVFGNDYASFPLVDLNRQRSRVTFLRRGSEVMVIRVRSLMLPVQPTSGPRGTLPHLFAVNAFFTIYRRDYGDVIEVGLQIHNGFVDQDTTTDKDDVLGAELFFDDLRVDVPTGWSATQQFQSPDNVVSNGNGFWLARPLAGSKKHVMKRFGQVVTRFGLSRSQADQTLATDLLRRRALAFALPTGRWSWQSLGRYVSSARLPSYDHLNVGAVALEARNRLAGYEQAFRSGNTYANLNSGRIGYTHPFYSSYGGQTGGNGIEPVPGQLAVATQDPAAYLLEEFRLSRVADRHAGVFTDADGAAIHVRSYTQSHPTFGKVLPFLMNDWRVVSNAQPFGGNRAITFQRDHVLNNGLAAPYRAALNAYQSIDVQHAVRYAAPAWSLCMLGNDPLAGELNAQAANVYTLISNPYEVNQFTPPGDWGLRNMALVTGVDQRAGFTANPGQGTPAGRENAWGHLIQVMAVRLDPSQASRLVPFLDKAASCFIAGQSPTGTLMRRKILQHQASLGNSHVLQQFEECFLSYLIKSMRESVYRGRMAGRDAALGRVLTRQAVGAVTYAWSASAQRPYNAVGVAPADYALPAYPVLPGNAFFANDFDEIYWHVIAAHGYDAASGASATRTRGLILQRVSAAYGNLAIEFENRRQTEWLSIIAPSIELFGQRLQP